MHEVPHLQYPKSHIIQYNHVQECVLEEHGEIVLLDFSLSVKAAPHECVIRTSQPQA